MSESNQSTTKASWFFMRDYKPDPKPEEDDQENESKEDISEMQELLSRLQLQDKALNELGCKVYDLEQRIIPKLEDLDNKLDKLIQSNKSLIAYFSAISDRDARNLNYRIRTYASKNNHLPPASFVPEHCSSEL